MPHKTRVSQGSQIELSTTLEGLEKSVGLNICTDKRASSERSIAAEKPLLLTSTFRWFPQQFEVGCFGGSGCPLLRRTDKSPRRACAFPISRDSV
jgi:hypothetical protein